MSAWFGTTWFGRWFGAWFGDAGGPIVLADPQPNCLHLTSSVVSIACTPALSMRVPDGSAVSVVIQRGPCG
ncbi:MAG TPA: hypothetical protein VFQ42_22265 [Mycobacterium sp.]|nr:hypothetical protein [Mycobacterium sp.]